MSYVIDQISELKDVFLVANLHCISTIFSPLKYIFPKLTSSLEAAVEERRSVLISGHGYYTDPSDCSSRVEYKKFREMGPISPAEASDMIDQL